MINGATLGTLSPKHGDTLNCLFAFEICCLLMRNTFFFIAPVMGKYSPNANGWPLLAFWRI